MESGNALAQEIAALRILPRDATPEQFLQAYVLPTGTDSKNARTRGDISRPVTSAIKTVVQGLYEGTL